MTSEIDFSRVNVVGTSGSGKSYFSKAIAARLGHPRIELDSLFWEPDWKQPPDETFFKKVATSLDQSTWVLDGNYDRTVPIKWKNVTTVIWIDYSFSRTLYQALKRAIVRSLTQEELWPGTGNRESFAKSFLSKESIVLWTLKTFGKVRKRYETRMADPQYSRIRFVRLRSPAEARHFLDSI